MSASGPGQIHKTSHGPPRGNAAKVLLPIAITPFALLFGWNYLTRGNPLKTAGVSNIENSHSAGGATKTHTVAYGGTPRGNAKDDTLAGNPSSQVGGKQDFEARNSQGQVSHGDEQRATGKGGKGAPGMMADAMYGTKEHK